MRRTNNNIFRIKQALLVEVDSDLQEDRLRDVAELLAEAAQIVDDLWDENNRGELLSVPLDPIASNDETLFLWDLRLRNKLVTVDHRLFELARATMKDGLGNPVIDDADYYVQDTRSGGCIGNCVRWWAHGGAGYTCRILEAGTYKGSAVRAMRETDLGWPKAFVDARTVVHVDVQMLRKP